MKGLGGLFKQAQKIQDSMQQAQQEVEKLEVVGESGAGMIKVTMNGRHDILNVQIDDSVLTEEKSLLEDLFGAAVNDANTKLEKAVKKTMHGFTGGIDLPPGIKMPF